MDTGHLGRLTQSLGNIHEVWPLLDMHFTNITCSLNFVLFMLKSEIHVHAYIVTISGLPLSEKNICKKEIIPGQGKVMVRKVWKGVEKSGI